MIDTKEYKVTCKRVSIATMYIRATDEDNAIDRLRYELMVDDDSPNVQWEFDSEKYKAELTGE